MNDVVSLDPLARRLTAMATGDVATIARTLRFRRTMAERAERHALANWHDALLISVSSCGLVFRETRKLALAAVPSRDLAALIVDYGRELAQHEQHGGPVADVTASILAELRDEMRRRRAGAAIESTARRS